MEAGRAGSGCTPGILLTWSWVLIHHVAGASCPLLQGDFGMAFSCLLLSCIMLSTHPTPVAPPAHGCTRPGLGFTVPWCQAVEP